MSSPLAEWLKNAAVPATRLVEGQVQVGALFPDQRVDLVGQAEVLGCAVHVGGKPCAQAVLVVNELVGCSKAGGGQLFELSVGGVVEERRRTGDTARRGAGPCPLTRHGISLDSDSELLLGRDGGRDSQTPAEALGGVLLAVTARTAGVIASGHGDSAVRRSLRRRLRLSRGGDEAGDQEWKGHGDAEQASPQP